MTTRVRQLTTVVKTITQEQLNQYAQASGDRNPLHLDANFARTTPFGGIIAHGMLTLDRSRSQRQFFQQWATPSKSITNWGWFLRWF